MYVLHDSRRLLELHSPAAANKHVFFIMIMMGLAICAVSVLSIIAGFIVELFDHPGFDYIAGGGFFIFFGVCGAVIGLVGYRNTNDLNLRFDGDSECLIVRQGQTERRIPFDRIVKADVFDDGGDSVVYVVRIIVRDPAEEIKSNDRVFDDPEPLKPMADKINRFLRLYRPDDVSINLADADLATMAKEVISNLWNGTPAVPAAHIAPVAREGDVLFVCPECGYETSRVEGPPPYECAKCDHVVHLQDRTPGRMIVLTCRCGFTFSAAVSFVGTKRPCPKCGRKCMVEEAPKSTDGTETAIREE